jgi:polyketide cyclase/dehydrase/lipid transport protein
MASWKQQALIEAPVKDVWDVLSDPVRGPDWDQDVLAVTGAPVKIEKGSTFELTGRSPLGVNTTSFKVEEFDEMHELKMRCQRSGFYAHWLLTRARDGTFTELELGVQLPPNPDDEVRTVDAAYTKTYLRKAAEKTLEGLRRVVKGSGARTSGS